MTERSLEWIPEIGQDQSEQSDRVIGPKQKSAEENYSTRVSEEREQNKSTSTIRLKVKFITLHLDYVRAERRSSESHSATVEAQKW